MSTELLAEIDAKLKALDEEYKTIDAQAEAKKEKLTKRQEALTLARREFIVKESKN